MRQPAYALLIALLFAVCVSHVSTAQTRPVNNRVDLVVGGAYVYHRDRNEGEDVAPVLAGVEKSWRETSRLKPFIGTYVISSDSHYCPMATVLGGARLRIAGNFGSYLRAGPAFKCINPQREYRLQPWAELGFSYSFAGTWSLEAGVVPKSDPIGLVYLTRRFRF